MSQLLKKEKLQLYVYSSGTEYWLLVNHMHLAQVIAPYGFTSFPSPTALCICERIRHHS